jgi:hypothetical protein
VEDHSLVEDCLLVEADHLELEVHRSGWVEALEH